MDRTLMSSSSNPSPPPPPPFSPSTTSTKSVKYLERRSSSPRTGAPLSATDRQVRDPGASTPLAQRPNPPEFSPLLSGPQLDEEHSTYFPSTNASTNPIAIPIQLARRGSTPTSPLTGREEKGGHYFPFDEGPSPAHHRKHSTNPFQSRSTLRRGQLKLPSKMRTNHSPSPSSPVASTVRPTMVIPSSPRSRVGKTGSPLQLPGLPRFHPANYPSDSGSTENTPTSGVYRGNETPHMHSTGQYSEAQRQIHAYQREMLASASQGVKRQAQNTSNKPTSPRLVPLGSPGPITPLELGEEQGGYLVAGARKGREFPQSGQQELVDRFIRDETRPRLNVQGGRVAKPRTPGRR
jgi:hypothetical protein